VRTIERRYSSRSELAADYEENLQKRRAFVAQSRDLRERERCLLALVLEEENDRFELDVEVAWVGDDGSGL
jgi:hypothetical protein